MSAPTYVTVVADGMTILFRGNGDGQEAWATVKGTLRPDDAARLTQSLASFMADAGQPLEPEAPLRIKPRKGVIAEAKQAAPRKPHGNLGRKRGKYVRSGLPDRFAFVAWIATHDEGVTRDEIVANWAVTDRKSVNAILYREREQGTLRQDDEGRHYATAAGRVLRNPATPDRTHAQPDADSPAGT